MLKRQFADGALIGGSQPPSGGCVLKRQAVAVVRQAVAPAAFRRLCVETVVELPSALPWEPAAFRRLCVETYLQIKRSPFQTQPPSGGCVLKHCTVPAFKTPKFQPPSGGCVLKPMSRTVSELVAMPSRLQAAVC